LYVTLYYVGGSLGALVPALFWTRYGWNGCVVVFAGGTLFTLVSGLLSAPKLAPSRYGASAGPRRDAGPR
jgi:hypothetical protein